MTTTQEPLGGSVDVPGEQSGPRWWQRPWVLPLAFVAVVFLVFSLPPYLGLNASQSRVPAPSGLAWYYPVLVVHVGFASVAMLTCVLQVWPWFRQHYPIAHRRVGRVYVFAGVLPAGAAGLAVAAVSPFGPVAAASNVLLASLWLLFTIAGFRQARARRFAEHRKWMIRSFALTMSIITNRVWAIVWIIMLTPQFDTTYGGNEQLFTQTVAGLTTWTGWIVPLLIAQWWLERPASRRRTRRGVAQRGPLGSTAQ